MVEVPALTGNPIRGKMRRLIGTEQVNIIFEGNGQDFETKIKNLIHTILAGGSKETGQLAENAQSNFYYMPVDVVEKMYQHLPVVGLLGGVLNGVFVPGCLISGFAVPVVVELNGDAQWDKVRESLLGRVDMADSDLVSVNDYIDRVKNWSISHARVITPELHGLIDMSPMPYGEDVLPARYPLWHYFTLEPLGDFKDLDGRPVFELMRDFLLGGIKLLRDNGYLGAKRAIGEGRVEYHYIQSDGKEPDYDLAYERMVGYLKRHLAEIREYMTKVVFDDFQVKLSTDEFIEGHFEELSGLINDLRGEGSPEELIDLVVTDNAKRVLLNELIDTRSKVTKIWRACCYQINDTDSDRRQNARKKVAAVLQKLTNNQLPEGGQEAMKELTERTKALDGVLKAK